MRALALRAAAAVAVAHLAGAGSGCSAALDFDECDVDGDCLGRASDGGPKLYCTDKHMCVDPTPCEVSFAATATGTPLVIGGLYRLSTDVSVKSVFFRHASDVAARQLNVLGAPVTHIACDTAGKPAGAQLAFERLVAVFHAVAVVGPDTSDEVINGILPVIRSHDIPVISPAATSPAISNADDRGLMWRTAPSDILQSQALADLIETTGARLDIVYPQNSAYALGLQEGFLQRWMGVVERSITFVTGHAAEAVAQMGRPTDALFIADVDAPAIVAALKEQSATNPNLSTTRFYMTEGAVGPTLWGPGPSYDYTFLARFQGTAPGLPPIEPDPSAAIYKGFRGEYTASFPAENPDGTAFVANAYDAFWSVALAALAAGDDRSGGAVLANLARLSDQEADVMTAVGPNGYANGLQELKAGRNINLLGASGPIDFLPNGDIKSAPIQIWDIERGSDGLPRFGQVNP
jgi:branched-chain amino acid transport system substrate-binding protein